MEAADQGFGFGFGPLFEPARERPAGGAAVIDAAESSVDVFSRAVVLQLQFRRLGTARKVDTSEIGIVGAMTAESQQKARALLRVTKTILDSPELQAIDSHDGATARFVDTKKAGPAFANQGGFHLIPLAAKDEIDQWLDTRERERADLIEAFIDALPARIAATVEELGPLAKDIKYPTRGEAREAFGVTRRYMSFGYADANAARAWQAEALTECRATLRAAFAELVARLSSSLQPNAEGKKRAVYATTVDAFNAFVQDFEGRNLADDGELADLVTRARALMGGRSVEELRDDGSFRKRAGVELATISEAAAAIVGDKPTRRYGDE